MNLTAKGRLIEWAGMVDEWKRSGMNQKDWCRVHGLGYDAFKYRKAKVEKYAEELLDQRKNDIVALPEAVPEVIEHEEPVSTAYMKIQLPQATISLTSGVSSKMLKTALEVLTNA